jgi:pimeloyl-ACP methyl ester carboxylesterase
MTRDKLRTKRSRNSLVVAEPVTNLCSITAGSHSRGACWRWNFRDYVTTAALLTIGLVNSLAQGEEQISLRSGLSIRGSVVEVASLNQNPFAAGAAGEVQVRPIWMIDDGLRRTYVYKLGMVADVNPVADLSQKVELWQPAPLGGKTVAGLGPILAISPFNDYGRRMVSVRGPEGSPLSIIQGITELNPRYAKIEGLKSTPSYLWDMRVATDSIPTEQLRQIFRRRIDQQNYDKRLEIVRFYIECQRFAEARDELERLIIDFPDDPRLATQLQALVERQGTQLLDEAKLRREAGQYKLAMDILKNFPLAEVARVTRIEVQDSIDSIEGRLSEGRKLLAQLRGQIDKIVDGAGKTALLGLVDEMDRSLSLDTLNRLSDYSRLGGVDNIPVDNRIALAIGGWLMGPGSGLQNLAVATSLIEVRSLVSEYLGTQDEPTRKAILEKLRGIEGADAIYVSKILPLIVPPLSLPEEAKDDKVAGMYRMDEQVDGRAKGRYVIQLPPEYDPMRSYPCIVALHPLDGTAEGQIDYWAGVSSADGSIRMGQGARHGFVLVAPYWTRTGQRGYESTPREHAEVLSAIRDAMRRVSIDSDRVFLTGLGAGGSAAWDIAVSHPDIWAGLISISGEPNNYLRHYSLNAAYLPMYLLFGELAGAPAPLIKHGDVLDDYMAPGFRAMVVMYRGRGSEHFYEEIHRLFDWMRLATHKRGDPPQKIETASMRLGDQFFWWLEMPNLKENVVIDPILWDQAERLRAAKVSASVGEGNQIRISQGPTEQYLIHLSPQMGVEMDQTITIRYRTRRVDFDFDGSVDGMLEDARTRADRKRPYWASVLVP